MVIRLKPGREKPLLRRHPWIFSGAVERVDGSPPSGAVCDVLSSSGEWLAYAAYSPQSQIRGRVLGWRREIPIDEPLIRERIASAIASRAAWQAAGASNAWREVFSESDDLPGVIVDRYDDIRVLQLHTAWSEAERDLILDALTAHGDCRAVYERSDLDVRRLEGLEQRTGLLWGEYDGTPVPIQEGGLQFLVDIEHGHKTGFYLDQRESRAWLGRLSPSAQVLDAFAYTGAFSLVCLQAGSEHVTAIDSSGPALRRAAEQVRLNRFQDERFEAVEADVFSALRGLRDRARSFDLVILDPPKFAATTSQVGRAARAYKDINLLGLKLLNPGGLLASFSCSGGVSTELFQKILADAALDAGVQASIVHRFHQAADHPVQLSFPESEYLKGFLLQVAR